MEFFVPGYLRVQNMYFSYLTYMYQRFGGTSFLLIQSINLFTFTLSVKATVCTKILMPVKLNGVISQTNRNQDIV